MRSPFLTFWPSLKTKSSCRPYISSSKKDSTRTFLSHLDSDVSYPQLRLCAVAEGSKIVKEKEELLRLVMRVSEHAQ